MQLLDGISEDKMSKQRCQFSAEFKTKIVLELLEGKQILNQIASKCKVLPKILQVRCSFAHRQMSAIRRIQAAARS